MHMTENELRNLSTAEKVELMRKKRTIGDWFLAFCIFCFVGIVALDVVSDQTVSKMLATFEKMTPKAK